MAVNPFLLHLASDIPVIVYTLTDKVIKPTIKDKKRLVKIDEVLSELRLASSISVMERLNHATNKDFYEFMKTFYDVTTFEKWEKEVMGYYMYFVREDGPLVLGTYITYLLLLDKRVISSRLKKDFKATMEKFVDSIQKDLLKDEVRIAKRMDVAGKRIISKTLAVKKITLEQLADTERLAEFVTDVFK